MGFGEAILFIKPLKAMSQIFTQDSTTELHHMMPPALHIPQL